MTPLRLPGRTALTIVFAKAPVAGSVKTRLFPALGAQGAARLHMRLVRRALDMAVRARCGPVELHHAPARPHAWLRALAVRHGVRLRPQRGGDVGWRMHHAFVRALHRHRGVVLIGSDCPELRPHDLRRAVRCLADRDAVIAPAEDGGYPLIALRRCSSQLFEGIDWGGGEVMAQTRGRLAGLGWRWRELRTLWDVDRPDDLGRLSACMARGMKS